MIPQFPQFKKIELTDINDVENFTSKFPPYSDFNFASMWSWDINGKMRLSVLYNNLVVLFTDYNSGNNFLSFIGKNNIPETISELIHFSKTNYKINYLKLVPEEVVDNILPSSFLIKTDRDSYDYVYSVAHLANMNNWTKGSYGKKIRKFIKSNNNYSINNLSIKEIQVEDYKKIFKKWAQNKNIDNYFELNEYKAFNRFLEIKNDKIKFISIYINANLAGFTAYEILSNDFAISHFAKADIEHFSMVTDLLNWEEAKLLNKEGIKYFNWEQDLGIPGLRFSKEKLKQSFFLKKIIVNDIT